MELEIVKNLETILEKESNKFKDDSTLTAFEKASIEFNKLVQNGVVKRRGYNLMTIEMKHLHQFSINTNVNNKSIL
jgi:hypothetical protein